jgi:hypothetical protein
MEKHRNICHSPGPSLQDTGSELAEAENAVSVDVKPWDLSSWGKLMSIIDEWPFFMDMTISQYIVYDNGPYNYMTID